MAVDYPLHIDLARLFGEWNAQRVSRFLGVNPRTIQRWLKDADGEQADMAIPDDKRALIRAQVEILDREKVSIDNWLDTGIEQMRDMGIHDEIIASWLSVHYRRLTGLEIE